MPIKTQIEINPFYKDCYDYNTIIERGGKIKTNIDGSISVYIPNNIGVLAPVILNKICCEKIGAEYYFDIDSQKCYKHNRAQTSNCGINDVFKIVLNPKGNDGALFYLDENETCHLSVDFDYLFKINCSTLSNITNPSVVGSIGTPVSVPVQTDAIPVKEVKTKILEQEKLCASYQYKLDEIKKSIENTPYSIECLTAIKPLPQKVEVAAAKTSFNRTAFGGNSALAPFGMYFAPNTGTFCLTEPDGLNAWRKILGEIRYQAFINGDPNSYSCSDVEIIVQQNANNLLTNQPVLVNECSVPFGTKTQLIKEYNDILKLAEECKKVLSGLKDGAGADVPPTTFAESFETSTNCSKPLDFFETFSVSMTVDVVNDDNSLQTVYEQPLFGPIGSGNLYNYLSTAGTHSGFYVCGDPNQSETNFNGCTPMLFDFQGLDELNVTACEKVVSNILEALYDESGLDAQSFQSSLSVSALTSSWLHFSTLISDPSVISLIENKKIKVSFKINHTCGSFCVLVDEISLNKICTEVKDTSLFITQPPGFNLERIRDNKKSWIANTTPVNRVFDIKTALDTNPIRQTNYDVNDERLVINTKEIDLDINIAAGVEHDVWCYVVDNPCLLSASCISTTGYCCDPCVVYSASCGNKSFQDDECFLFQDAEVYEFMDGDYTQFPNTTLNGSNCCGDSDLDFNKLMTQPLSSVTTIEDFEYYLISELTDAKNRQTISSYPTLKALYERYLNSLDYCESKSSGFNYMTMDQFAGLIDSYWVDIVEQVVPATTIWGSVKIYSNTLFDQQKFKYKAYTSLFCNNPYSGKTISSPINGTSGYCESVEVIASYVKLVIDPSIKSRNSYQYCDSVCLSQMNMGSEFIGSVSIMGASASDCSTPINGGSMVINECTLQVTVETDGLTANTIVIGAVGDFDYLWSDGQIGSIAEFSSAGTYSVTVTDSACCKAIAEFTVKEKEVEIKAIAEEHKKETEAIKEKAIEEKAIAEKKEEIEISSGLLGKKNKG